MRGGVKGWGGLGREELAGIGGSLGLGEERNQSGDLDRNAGDSERSVGFP